MKETCIFIQALITGVFAMLYEKLGIFLPLMSIFMALMVMDYLSGMLASKHEAIEHPGDPAYGWNSKKGVNGIIKKVGYILSIDIHVFKFKESIIITILLIKNNAWFISTCSRHQEQTSKS